MRLRAVESDSRYNIAFPAPKVVSVGLPGRPRISGSPMTAFPVRTYFLFPFFVYGRFIFLFRVSLFRTCSGFASFVRTFVFIAYYS